MRSETAVQASIGGVSHCRVLLVALVAMSLFVAAGSAKAMTVQQQQILNQTGVAASDSFGYSVALSADGNTAIIGAASPLNGGPQGSATIFTRTSGAWTQQQVITRTNPESNDCFGCAVAMSADGNTAIIGAYGATVNGHLDQGSATIFTRSGNAWTQQQTISQSNGAADDWFGISLALSSDGNTAIIGASDANVGRQLSQGRATVFTRSGARWTQQKTITRNNGAAMECFGSSVALSSDGNTAIIGAAFASVGGKFGQGNATIFTRSGTRWTQQKTITQTNGAVGDSFGNSVALSSSGNTAIIGASQATVGGKSNQGSATVFTRSGTRWTQQKTITEKNGAANDNFGNSVALSADGNTAIIGANAAALYDKPTGLGSATIFTRSASRWTQQKKIPQAKGAAGLYFGYSVALSSDGYTTIISANGATAAGNAGPGSATVYTLQTLPSTPRNVSATNGVSAASVVSWRAPAKTGGSPITGYAVTASPGGASCSWTSGPHSCTVSGLTNGVAYTFTVKATNAMGTSAASPPSKPTK